jgi:transcriptional regulator GlxA family with amidase domain
MPSDRTDALPPLLRRAIAFIDDNAHTGIGLTDIAEAIHLTPRAVQYMFNRHVDTTPVTYLRRVRLDLAHRDLAAADPRSDTVTAIAARWGWAHPGRFSVVYKTIYAGRRAARCAADRGIPWGVSWGRPVRRGRPGRVQRSRREN